MEQLRVEARNLRLAYGATPVLSDVTLTVEPGEFYALLGSSGSGKSTLLRAIAGFARPQGGRLLVGGRDVTDVPPWKRNVGMVFQNYALWPHLSVARNVAFGLEERRLPRADVQRRTAAALDLVGLAGYGDRWPGQLSGGQQQRVALARTLAIEPQVLLLDEPLSNLDAKLRVQMRQELLRLHRRLGITTIFVTHDQDEAMTMSDRIAVLEAGVIQQIGTPVELFDVPANRFVAQFVGSVNVFEGRVDADGTFSSALLGRVKLPPDAGAPARPCDGLLTFRPHAVSIVPAAAPGGAAGSASTDLPAPLRVDGHVAGAEFLGEVVRYEIRVGAATLVAHQSRERGTAQLPAGTPVRLRVPARELRLIPT